MSEGNVAIWAFSTQNGVKTTEEYFLETTIDEFFSETSKFKELNRKCSLEVKNQRRSTML
jgi:hypothetical protein